MFPKTKIKKRRRKHPPSILHKKDGTCYLCIKLDSIYCKYPVTHKHHVYGGPNRRISEENGFTVNLCPGHHEFTEAAVHRNYEYMRLIQEDCQREYEKEHTRQQFMDLIGKNYLEDKDDRDCTG